MTNLDTINEHDTFYDRILGDNFLAMFNICLHELEWVDNYLVIQTLFSDEIKDLPPLFVTCVNCAGLYPAPRYIELL